MGANPYKPENMHEENNDRYCGSHFAHSLCH